MNPTNLIPQWQFDDLGKFTGIKWVLPEHSVSKTHSLSESTVQETEPSESQLDEYSKAS